MHGGVRVNRRIAGFALGLVASMLIAAGLGLTHLVPKEDLNESAEMEPSSHYVLSRSVNVTLGPEGILESRYEVVVDTGIPDNPYAKGEVVLELWIGSTRAREARGSWDISGYPVKSNSTYTYVCLWPCNLSGLEQVKESVLVKVLPADPRQIELSTEARP